MKNTVLLLLALVASIGFQANAAADESGITTGKESIISNDPGGAALLVINSLDSVYFDLSAALVTGASVEFPVYLKSDDVINALDFAFKYDHTKLEYDTILNQTTYIDALSFYNANDSTVRLTSYSFSQPYTNDSILFIVKFTVLSGQICSGDLNTVSALLNGDACTASVVECLNSAVNEYGSDLEYHYYPNPATDFVIFEFDKLTSIEITDITGKVVFRETQLKNEKSKKIDLNNFTDGVYLVKAVDGNKVAAGKLLVN